MTPEQYQRASELFSAALDLPPADRESFVLAQSSSDREISLAVLAMLAQHHAPSHNVDQPALGNRLDLASLFNSAPLPLPQFIGPYAVKSVLGEGGMSIVYRARQSFPARDVAVKVLRLTSVSPASLRRFRGEVDALARMTHPNIAQIYDAGAFTIGSAHYPYFAMELVDGLPIAQFAHVNNLSTPLRLRLLITVCHAVQHAHLRGIIHRDLKSSNILLTADGAPKVLDFGIARASDLDVTRATLHTQSGQILGTLGYMSPEQLTADPFALDLRTDVYALGAVLFETLTGQLPHPIEHLPLTQAIRRISDSPPRPLASLRPDLHGDLDVILATALQHDRARRYQSAQALADDLESFLAHLPIRARPPSRLRLLRMWTARHPALATAIILLALTALTVVVSLQVQRRRARIRLEDQIAQSLQHASAHVNAYADLVPQTRLRARELADLRSALYAYNPPDRALELERREQQLLRSQAEHEASFHRTLDSISSALRLGADDSSARLLAARLYLARLREAQDAGDRFARMTYQKLVQDNDPDNLLAGELIDRFPVSIATDPPGAALHLFRLVEQSELLPDGEPRLVPIPLNDPHPARTAAITRNFALAVLDGKSILDTTDLVFNVNSFPIRDCVLVTAAPPPLLPLDRLLSIDDRPVRELYDLPLAPPASSQPATHQFTFARPGLADPIIITGASLHALGISLADPAAALSLLGGPVTIHHLGQISSLLLPPSLQFHITSKPLLLNEFSLVGTAPFSNLQLPRGAYLALAVHPGFEPLRIPLQSPEPPPLSTSPPPWNLLPIGSTPHGFVRLPDSLTRLMRPLWIMQHEVTVADYLLFLNDPLTLEIIDASPLLTLVPRSAGIPEFVRTPNGAFNPGPELQPNWPVPCISWHDASAYARWLTSRARAAGQDVHFDLPSHQEWLSAWGCSGENQFPWGHHFRPWWTSSNYARAIPQVEPVNSFPIDESNVFIFDLAGSLSEWLNAWWMDLHDRDLREIAGGSWGHGGFNYREMFMLYGQNGISSRATSGTVGFRLVMRLGPPPSTSNP